MHLNAITIRREGYYGSGTYSSRSDPTKPLHCTVEVQGPMGKTELNLPPEVRNRLISLIANELAAQTKRVAEVMTASFINTSAVLTDQTEVA
jgi:hypothetical protein